MTPAFDVAFERVVDARLAESAQLDALLAEARAVLPDDEVLGARLAGDLEHVASSSLEVVRSWRALVEEPSAVDLDDASKVSGPLLARWLGRHASRFDVEHLPHRSHTQVQLAVRLAEETGDALDHAWSLFVRASVIARLVVDAGYGSGDVAGDMQRASELLEQVGRLALHDVVDLQRALWRGYVEGGDVLIDELCAISSDETRVVSVRGAALAREWLTLRRFRNWEAAEVVSSRLADLEGEITSGAQRFHVDLALGVAMLDRAALVDGENEMRLRLRSVEHLERALAEATHGHDRVETMSWLAAPLVQLGNFDQAMKIVDEIGLLAAAIDPGSLLSRRLHLAYIALSAGEHARAMQILVSHRDAVMKGRAVADLDSRSLRSLYQNLELRGRVERDAGASGDAVESMSQLAQVEDLMIAQTPRGSQLYAAADASETHARIVGILDHLVSIDGASLDDVFLRGSASIEHARARLLRRDLTERGVEGLAQLFDPSSVPITASELPSLPDGVLELRWFVATDLVDLNDEPPTYQVLLARLGARVRFVRLAERKLIDARIEAFLERWFAPAGLGGNAADYERDAAALTRALLGSASAWLADDTVERVLLMPNGATERLPFAALVRTVGEPARRFSDVDFLVRSVEVVHAPSWAILESLPEPSRDERAVGVFIEEPGGLQLGAVRSERESLDALRPGSTWVDARDVDAIQSALVDASYGWLHVATHAEVFDDVSRSAELVLTDGTRLGREIVADLPLRGGTRVVLSACDTATGAFHLGEGVLGLWRAFILAGASSVVASLADVDDASTATFMAAFHRHASADVPLATALRRASLDWLDGSARPIYPRGSAVVDPDHPYLWGTWVCVGDDGGPLPGD